MFIRPDQEMGDIKNNGWRAFAPDPHVHIWQTPQWGTEKSNQEEKPWLDQFSTFFPSTVLGTGFHFLSACA